MHRLRDARKRTSPALPETLHARHSLDELSDDHDALPWRLSVSL